MESERRSKDPVIELLRFHYQQGSGNARFFEVLGFRFRLTCLQIAFHSLNWVKDSSLM